ncbi:antigen p97 [Branchiostoma belcheri]|nr:antigen p97 [Branchiostoma belcheri]
MPPRLICFQTPPVESCKPVRQFVKHPAPSFQDCQTVRQVPRCPETCRPTKTSFAEEQFDCRGRTLNKDVLIHEACACVECAVKHTKESWHSSERQPSSNERWSDELGFPWF